MHISDFEADNLGAAEVYTVYGTCRRIRVIEKDRTATTLARYRISFPHLGTGADTLTKEPGEEYIHETGSHITENTRPFALETVNVSTTTFTVIEE